MNNSDPEFPLAYKALQTIDCLSVLNGNITQTESGQNCGLLLAVLFQKIADKMKIRGGLLFPALDFHACMITYNLDS